MHIARPLYPQVGCQSNAVALASAVGASGHKMNARQVAEKQIRARLVHTWGELALA